MFGFKRIANYIWYKRKLRNLIDCEEYCKYNLSHFYYIRTRFPHRSHIGKFDFTNKISPKINDKKKGKLVIGNSEYVFRTILKEIQYEYKKLYRWQKYLDNSKSKVVFS